MLDWSTHTPSLEELARKSNEWPVSLAGVRRVQLRLETPNNSLNFSLLWGISGAFLGVYAFLQRLNIPLMIQPQLFSFLCFISWGQVRSLLSFRENIFIPSFHLVSVLRPKARKSCRLFYDTLRHGFFRWS